tara:strand:+ start:301 stop:1035 length:735 start_codon:yes stop_codon:yes gene_type:complete
MRHVFIIGAQRCGTTFIADYLSAHSSIQVIKPLKPEPKFFSDIGNHQFNKDTYFNKFFINNPNTNFFIEKSTNYIENVKALKHIKKLFPNGKILILLRNPIYRAYSNYKFSYESGLESKSFLEAINSNPKKRPYKSVSSNPFNYLERGLYINYIKEVDKIFDKKNIKIFILEELMNTNLNELLKFFNLSSLNIDYFRKSKKNISDNSLAIKDEEIDLLKNFYLPSVRKLEKFLDRKITTWNEFR